MKKYCQKCGHPNEYNLKKPEYCGKCKQPFYSIELKNDEVKSNYINKNIAIKEAFADIDIIDDEGAEFIDVETLKEIKNLEFEELAAPRRRKETIGSIINSGSDSAEIKKSKKKNKKLSKKESQMMLKEVLDEGKSLRPKK